MLQIGRDLDLRHEPFDAEHGAEFRVQDLERDLAIVLEIAREVHSRHAALADAALDGVAAPKGGVELLGGMHGSGRNKVRPIAELRQLEPMHTCRAQTSAFGEPSKTSAEPHGGQRVRLVTRRCYAALQTRRFSRYLAAIAGSASSSRPNASSK